MPELPPFSLTFDYRCPWARIVHEHVALALLDGAPWKVTFVPFSLDQPSVPEGAPPAWRDPARIPSQLATCAALSVRDAQPDHFVRVHDALYRGRHEGRLDLRSREALTAVLEANGADAAAVWEDVDSGRPLEVLGAEHTRVVRDLAVFGVPTFILADGTPDADAVFVRYMDRPAGDAAVARATVERIVGQIAGWPQLNEFKHTRVSR